MITAYQGLMITLLKNKEGVSDLWNRCDAIKPEIIASAYNPTSSFIENKFKSDQAYIQYF